MATLPSQRRKLLLPAVGLALLVAVGWYVMRTGPNRNTSVTASERALPTAPAAGRNVASALPDAQSISDAAAAQAVAVLNRGQTPAPAAADPALPSPAHTAERDSASRAQVAARTPRTSADGGQARPAAAAPLGKKELLARCRSASGRGKPALVVAACEPVIEVEPTATDILVLLARAELDRGKALEARSWAKKAVAVSPNLADAYVILGGAEQELGNSAEAKTAYAKYLELAPKGRYAPDLRAVLNSL